MLLEDEAAAGKGTWSAAFRHWQSLALRLANARPKPSAYYDAWYHAALALKNDRQAEGSEADARPRDAALTHCRRSRDEEEVQGPTRPDQVK